MVTKKVNIVAMYTAGTYSTNIFDKDEIAEKIMSQFVCEDIGRGTYVPTMERDICWEINEEDAANAAVLLRDAGFRTQILEMKDDEDETD